MALTFSTSEIHVLGRGGEASRPAPLAYAFGMWMVMMVMMVMMMVMITKS